MYKAKLSERNRPYALRRSDKHRAICTCGTYLKTAYVLNRSNGISKWVKVGYYCPACSDFYKEPPVHIFSNQQSDPKDADTNALKHNLEHLFTKFD